ncbi:hypothetical protein M9H77_30614 [Catharanthus roseus]|uniref:Uncharacterized protein n=1 Tax=Catharanthus roseus TaxID=4058 RepID=A0ACB9ZXT2_CATRO|nr:hypothetical protein M9H77_30614 [Catharanthus roseus]
MNYELMAQVKDVTGRMNYVESSITRMNARKSKLDEMLQVSRPAGVKIELGYVDKRNTNKVPSESENDEGSIKEKNGVKTTKMETSTKKSASTAHGRLPYPHHFINMNTRLDYSQGCLELKKEEQSRTANWGLIGAID